MRYLVRFANEAYDAHQNHQSGPNIWRGVGWSLALSGLQLISTLCLHHYNYRSMMVGAMSRSALASIIYQKSLALSNKVYSLLMFVNKRHVWNIPMERSQT